MKFGQNKLQEFAQKFFSNIILFAFAFLAVNDLDVQKQRNPVKLHRTSCTCSKQGRTTFYYTENELKLICRNLYPLFSQVKKAYTANQNGVQLFHVLKYNESTIA